VLSYNPRWKQKGIDSLKEYWQHKISDVEKHTPRQQFQNLFTLAVETFKKSILESKLSEIYSVTRLPENNLTGAKIDFKHKVYSSVLRVS
jgi:cytoplasmic iron level regulating protein YaaA (DUF328/UPF0246 family)